MRLGRRCGVTLVELLVVVAIIGVLAALLLPAVQAARETARRAQCHSNLRELGIATALHANAHEVFPVGCLGNRGDFTVTPPLPARFISWNVHLLPYLEEQSLAESFDVSLPAYHAANKPVARSIIEAFLCPSTIEDALRAPSGLWKGAAFTDYGGIYGVEGPTRNRDDIQAVQTLRDDALGVLIYEVPVFPKQVSDGLSKTALIAETVVRREAESEWVNGQNLLAQDEATPMNVARSAGGEIGSPHPGGASLVFCDAHVEFVAESIEQALLNAMLTKAGQD
jgi:prepilin-type N-terminal cleavage/methylation domain-containing protein/prepilin-type processing-associated H-X9-DG protein